MLVGLLRARLARSHVGELVLELDHTPPEGIRDALARHLGDPSLELLFWLPERDGYVDAAGAAVELPAPGSTRSVTEISHDGERIAVIVHDRVARRRAAAPRRRPRRPRGSRSRTRVCTPRCGRSSCRCRSRAGASSPAGDEQRRRIERDIHDGAQQRLVALALELRATQRRLGGGVDPDVERVLTGAVEELQVAVSELRELARGVHPAILTEEGLRGALESLASRTPLDVRVERPLDERLPPEIEAAGYFLACEALANAVKHADASTRQDQRRAAGRQARARGRGRRPRRRRPPAGSGLRGLADRLEAHGGRLVVASAAGGGTRVVGEIPCAS